jgi:uncharacterized protein YmfQ (DUF2313 family)
MTIEQYRKQSPYRVEHYLLMLRKLLPRGKPWGFEVKSAAGDVWRDRIYPAGEVFVHDSIGAGDTVHDSIYPGFDLSVSWLGRYLSVFAEELRRLTDRAYQVANEGIPGLANEMLPEWLDCTIANNAELELVQDDEDDQRAFAHGKIYSQGKVVNAQFFIDYGVLLGFELEIDEYPLESEVMACSVDAAEFTAGACGVAVDPTAQANVLACGILGSFNVLEITIISGTGNLELMQSLFDYAVPAHVAIVWIDAR